MFMRCNTTQSNKKKWNSDGYNVDDKTYWAKKAATKSTCYAIYIKF